MDNQSGHVVTLANSIIGVSVLAMPYCFKQCGIILSIIMLLISSIISRLSCHFLLKSAIMARRKTFEFLAFYIFGSMGKFAIEIGIIGFLIGTCIAFFVVMGDLGPAIISEITGTHNSNTMRTSILMALALFCVLPLGLLRNVDSLNGVSKATIGFYCCLVLKIVFEATPHIVSGDWYQNVVFWRPAGIMQCLPIFSMALFCQTQLFEIYQAIHNATLERMNNLVRLAVNICTLVYIFVGVFGYIAFAQKQFSGNILLNFSPSFMTDIMKLGFVLSVAFSFPLVIFPCRASLYSLLYKEGYTIHESTSNYIPEGKFKALTMIIVFISLIIGIMIPNIELVLGLVGSTIGVMICVLFPVTCFICISPKNTNERILAQLMLMIGVCVMVLGTYKNLYTLDNLESTPATITNFKNNDLMDLNGIKQVDKYDLKKNVLPGKLPTTVKGINIVNNDINLEKAKTELPLLKITENQKVVEIRHEPPQPVEPQDEIEDLKEEKNKEQIPAKSAEIMAPFPIKIIPKENPVPNAIDQKQPDKVQVGPVISIKGFKSSNKTEVQNEEVDIEAIKKEDKEVELQEKDKTKEDDTNKVLIDTIQKQNEFQKEMVEQNKKLIEVIKNQQQKDEDNAVKEEKLKAVKRIESIALQAIQKISAGKENERVLADLEKKINENVQQKLKINQGLNQMPKDENNSENRLEQKNVLVEADKNKKYDPLIKINNPTVVPKVIVPEVIISNAENKESNNIQVILNKEDHTKPNHDKSTELVKPKAKPVNDINVKYGANEENKEQPVVNNSDKNIKSQTEVIFGEHGPNIKHNNEKPEHAKSFNGSFNNTAPLFLKLGKSEIKTNDKVPEKLVPFPIAIANILKNSSLPRNLSKSEEPLHQIKTIDGIKKNKDLNKISHENQDEIQAIRRDILAFTTQR